MFVASEKSCLHRRFNVDAEFRRRQSYDKFPIIKIIEKPKTMSQLDSEELKQKLLELQEEHRDLDGAISALVEQAAYDQLKLQRLKKRKLLLRDFIQRIEAMLQPDIIA